MLLKNKFLLSIRHTFSLSCMQFSKWKTVKKNQDIYLLPTKQPHTETLIFLHGLGDTAAGWVDIFYSDLNPVLDTTKVVLLTAPIAPVTLNYGEMMPSWYDIKTLNFSMRFQKFEDAHGVDEITKNTERISKVLDDEIKEFKGMSTRVAIGGFSQGCAMALHAGLTYNQPLAGILGFSGYLFPITKSSRFNENIPIFLSHGLDDEMIPKIVAEKSYEALDAKKHELIRLYEDGLGHSINENILLESKKFLSRIFVKPKL